MAIVTILTAVGLQAMSGDLAGDYELGSDIYASETAAWNGGAGFVPIGPLGTPFTGTFDGKGYKIVSLTVNRPLDDEQGLFATTDGATIQNVALTSVDIKGDNNVGGLIAWSDDTDITKCSVSGTVIADNLGGMLVGYYHSSSRTPTMSRCFSTGALESPSQDGAFGDCGGLIGYVAGNTYPPVIEYSYSTASVTATGAGTAEWLAGFISSIQSAVISRCFATGDVTGHDIIAGFICATSWGGGTKVTTIEDCYATGACVSTQPNVVAGFICYTPDFTDLDNCYSTGVVTGLAGNTSGFVLSDTSTGAISNCFWDYESSGSSTSDGGTAKTTEEMQTIATFQEAGWAISRIWNLLATCNNGYPCLIDVNTCCMAATGGDVDQSIVGNKVSLEAIRNLEIVYGGRFYIDKTGNAVYESRYHRQQ